jgi:hypothetical protein
VNNTLTVSRGNTTKFSLAVRSSRGAAASSVVNAWYEQFLVR